LEVFGDQSTENSDLPTCFTALLNFSPHCADVQDSIFILLSSFFAGGWQEEKERKERWQEGQEGQEQEVKQMTTTMDSSSWTISDCVKTGGFCYVVCCLQSRKSIASCQENMCLNQV